MPRRMPHVKKLHESADYYEPLLRARFVRGMKALQQSVSINELALALAARNPKQALALITRVMITAELQSTKKVLRDAFMRGGKVGAEHVRAVLE